jgi:hypothetical protein
MNGFLQFLSTTNAPGIFIIGVAIVALSFRKTGWVGEFINALNSLNTPWIAIIVLILGMLYNMKCKQYGLDSSSANQVIGAGIGLLTGQAIEARKKDTAIATTVTTQRVEETVNPQQPEAPAQPHS